MLYKLTSSHSSFKALSFQPGLNIVLAERAISENDASDNSLERLTRNGAGKTSVVDLIHFLLGGRPEGALKSKYISDWNFELTLDIGSTRRVVRRSVGDTGKIRVLSSSRVEEPESEEYSNAAWNRVLGNAWFGLFAERQAGSATYRQLFSYFVRRRRDGGFDSPTRTFRAQAYSSIETNLAVLFGLDPELVRSFHQTKASLKQIDEARKTLSNLEAINAEGDRKVDLEARLAAEIAASELVRNRLKERIEAFNVLPAFRELESELARLNKEGVELSDQDVLDRESISANRDALSAEADSHTLDLDKMFEEAQIVFPDIVRTRYKEVASFHAKLIENRRAHLTAEIDAAQSRIEARSPHRERVEERRRDITASLRSSGPAEELLRLRDELSAKDAHLSGLRSRLLEARRLEDRREEVEHELEEAARSLRQDRRERSTIVDEASRTFSEISERLYETPGQLVISATEDGLRFVPSIPSEQSSGVMSMQIFCFDLTIASLCLRRGQGPGFIVHDSHLFEPVDGRQFAQALRIAADFSNETGIQYITLLNSDELARAQAESGHDFSEYVVETKLSDAPNGGLFGIRFE